MPYLLALFAVIVPVWLVVQSVRGRVRVQCCTAPPAQDLRLRSGEASEHAGDVSGR